MIDEKFRSFAAEKRIDILWNKNHKNHRKILRLIHEVDNKQVKHLGFYILNYVRIPSNELWILEKKEKIRLLAELKRRYEVLQ